MGTVVSLHHTRQSRAKGAGIAAAICATRYGVDADHAVGFAAAARALVLAGHSAGMALTIVQRRIRRFAADHGPRVA
jgi:hypothetical protein